MTADESTSSQTPSAAANPSVIVVGFDGSDTGRRAASYAITTAKHLDARLVFVFSHNTSGFAVLARQVAPDDVSAMDELVTGLRETLDEALAGWDGEWELRTSVGSPFVAIIDAATEVGADVIVVGSTKRTGPRLAGSLAVHLVKAARWPITVVP